VCVISLSVSLLDISRTLIINYRWPAAIGLVPLWQPANTTVSFACICYVSVCIWRIKYYYYYYYYYYYLNWQKFTVRGGEEQIQAYKKLR